jgi:error-prone DNA polymerase
MNELRRAMATFRKRGTIGLLEQKMVKRMVERGYPKDFAERCFSQIKGFGEYGFPESHAASFALLVYVSSYLKCHYPAVFACGLLNSQPMGFYASAQIVRDAREHGVEVRAPDVNWSDWDSTLEPSPSPLAGEGGSRHRRETDEGVLQLATLPSSGASRHLLPQGEKGKNLILRLGLREVDGLKKEDAEAIVASRANSIAEFTAPVSALEKLAAADAFRSMGLDRRAALWEVKALAKAKPLPLFAFADTRDQGAENKIILPEMPLSEHVLNDYQTLKLSLKGHPMTFLRGLCEEERVIDNAKLKSVKNGASVSIAGIVLVRQRPGSAKGVVFLTIEDEYSICNAVVWPQVLETYRAIVMGSRLMLIRGRVQKAGEVLHLVANRIEDKTEWLARLTVDWNLLKNPLAHAGEVSARHPRNVRVIPKSRDFH